MINKFLLGKIFRYGIKNQQVEEEENIQTSNYMSELLY